MIKITIAIDNFRFLFPSHYSIHEHTVARIEFLLQCNKICENAEVWCFGGIDIRAVPLIGFDF